MNIAINRQSIIDKIEQITGYTGKNTEGGIDRISATADEKSVIDSLIDRGLTELAQYIADYKPVLNKDSITLDVPSSFDSSATPLLSKIIEDIASNYAISEWMMIAREKEDSAKYSAMAANNISLLINTLSRRERP